VEYKAAAGGSVLLLKYKTTNTDDARVDYRVAGPAVMEVPVGPTVQGGSSVIVRQASSSPPPPPVDPPLAAHRDVAAPDSHLLPPPPPPPLHFQDDDEGAAQHGLAASLLNPQAAVLGDHDEIILLSSLVVTAVDVHVG
jgi:hypothetical protein